MTSSEIQSQIITAAPAGDRYLLCGAYDANRDGRTDLLWNDKPNNEYFFWFKGREF